MIPSFVSTHETATSHILGRDPFPLLGFLFQARRSAIVSSTSIVRSSRCGLRLANNASQTVRGMCRILAFPE
jgi:hypothetical protein